jgi:flagellar hook-length control protein FliK
VFGTDDTVKTNAPAATNVNTETAAPVKQAAVTVVHAAPEALKPLVLEAKQDILPDIEDEALVLENTADIKVAAKSAGAETPEQRDFNQAAEEPEPETVTDETNSAIGVPQPVTFTTRQTVMPEPVRQPAATEVINQIADRIRVDVRGGVTEVRVLLRPESLGEVSLKIAAQNGIVTAQVIAQNQRVREIIESNFDELKDLLSQRGVEVSSLSVSVGNDEADEAMMGFMRQSERQAARSAQTLNETVSAETAERLTISDDGYDSTIDLIA